MARSFSQVLAEVTAKSDPQRRIVLDQVAALPGQQTVDETALSAKKDQAFEDIVGGARRRGLGFSGIPLGEQAKYTATDYAPALANLKSGYNTRRGTLESALADIGRSDYMSAQDIFGRDQQLAEQRRQFDLNYRLNQRQAADARRAATAASTFSPSFGGSAGSSKPKGPTVQDQAYLSVQRFLQGDDNSIRSDYQATLNSANRGNAMDKLKVQLYQQSRPDLFKPKKASGPTKIPFRDGFYAPVGALKF
jgi:hypothetical protein